MRIQRGPADLAAECAEEFQIIEAALPKATLVLRCQGDLTGAFDASAVREAMGNLVYNAAAYGDHAPVTIELEGLEKTVNLRVINQGAHIPQDQITRIFQPLKRGTLGAESSRTSLGLGLFIVDQIARAHGGEALCVSTPERTVFSLQLPRTA